MIQRIIKFLNWLDAYNLKLWNNFKNYFKAPDIIYSIAEHTIGEYKYYMATLSRDNGKTWESIHNQLMKSEVEAINIVNQYKLDGENWLKIEYKKL